MYQNKGPIKENNHVCPRCLIKQWSTYEQGRNGVYVYEIGKKKFSFSESKGKRGFSFAIEKFRYVPEINGQRTNALEDWLSGFEYELDTFIRNVIDEKPLVQGINVVDAYTKWNKLLHGILSLKHRNAHDLKKITQHFENNPHLKELVGLPVSENVELLVLQNLINNIMEDAAEFKICDFMIFHNPSGNLLLIDRPIFQEESTNHYIFPVTPYHLLSFTKSAGLTPSYQRNHLSDKMLESYNNLIIGRARDWVVSTKKELLEKYAPQMIAYDESEVPEYEKIKHLTKGFTIE